MDVQMVDLRRRNKIKQGLAVVVGAFLVKIIGVDFLAKNLRNGTNEVQQGELKALAAKKSEKMANIKLAFRKRSNDMKRSYIDEDMALRQKRILEDQGLSKVSEQYRAVRIARLQEDSELARRRREEDLERIMAMQREEESARQEYRLARRQITNGKV